MEYPKLPIRDSSLKAMSKSARVEKETKKASIEREKRKDGFEREKRKLDDEILEMNKRLKVKKQHSFDVAIWSSFGEIDSARVKANGLRRSISMLSMDLDDEDDKSMERWASTAEAKAILEQEAALKKSLLLMTRQVQKAEKQMKEKESHTRKSWAQLFINSRLGMNIIKPTQPRPSDRQKEFRKELIQVMNSAHPKQNMEEFYFWCPIVGFWVEKVEAGHLFPSKSGDELMKAIFGEPEQDMWIGQPQKGKSELFRACNGILWSEAAESRFSKGLFTIVPDLDENPSQAQSTFWQQSNPKEYRIRILRPNHKEMKTPLRFDSEILWKDLDNKRLQWRTPWRPRARYLYWAYCEMMLRQVYVPEADIDGTEVRRREVGKKYWGSGGPYMRKNMLLGFVEEMGHEYEHLLEGAMDADDKEDANIPEETAVMLANESIVEKDALIKWKESRVHMDKEDKEKDYDRVL